MRLKHLALLALLPIMTACAAECGRVMKFDGFQIGKERIDVPRYIREEKMSISWKLLTDNKKAFSETSKISYALDDNQYRTCMKLKTAPEAEKQALKDDLKRYNSGIDELMDILQNPAQAFPGRLEAWNKEYAYLAVKKGSKKESREDKLKQQDMEDEILMEKPAAPAPETAPAQEPAATGAPADQAPDTQKPAEGVSPAPATGVAPSTGTAPAPETTAPANGTAPAAEPAPSTEAPPATTPPATDTAPSTGTPSAPPTPPVSGY